jgi:hypothetical protein
MRGNPQTADDAIIYKPVAPRTVQLLFKSGCFSNQNPRARRPDTEKPGQTMGSPGIILGD